MTYIVIIVIIQTLKPHGATRKNEKPRTRFGAVSPRCRILLTFSASLNCEHEGCFRAGCNGGNS
jgi:hypothetical protein